MTKLKCISVKTISVVLCIIAMMVHTSCFEDEISGCDFPAVKNLNTVSVSQDKAEIRFTDNSGATSFSIKVSSAGTQIQSKDVSSQSAVLDNLAPDTEYIVEVRPNCPDGSHGTQPSTLTFRTKKSCTLSPVSNLAVTLDNSNILEAVWDAHDVATKYNVTIHDSHNNELLWAYKSLTETRFSINLYTGMSVYVSVSPVCQDGESVSENITSSSILTTQSIMPGGTVPSSDQPCITDDCSIIDAASQVLIPKGNSGGDYVVAFSSLSINSCRTMYFRFSWSGGYADVPLFLIKNNGKTTVYTQSATCTAFSNDLQRKNADLLRQTVKINGHDRYFGIVCYKNEVRFFVPPDIELKGKTL